MKRFITLSIAILCLFSTACKSSSSEASIKDNSSVIQQETVKFSVNKYGDPKDEQNSWEITDDSKVKAIQRFIDNVLSTYEIITEIDEKEVANGTEMYALKDSEGNELVVRNITGNVYNVKYNSSYYEVSENDVVFAVNIFNTSKAAI